MLKRSSIRKISLAAFCLLILLILYLFPKKEENEGLTMETNYTVTNIKDALYLLDSKDYVSRINVNLTGSTVEEKTQEIISYLTQDSTYKDVLPNGFKGVLPVGTKVLGIDLRDGNLKVNFSKELLEIDANEEMHMIEALTFSLTEIDGIESITILVEGEILNKLPVSGEYLPNPLNRSFGINKKYDIENIKDTTKTTLYYIAKNDNFYYYVPVTKISNDKSEKIEIIVKELSTRPIYETSLMSYLNSEATLQNYEFLDKSLNLEFNNAILSDITSNDILEEVTYAINLSIRDNYDVDAVMYIVNNEKIATFDIKSLE